MVDYKTGVVVAECGCRFLVGEMAVSQEVEPGIFEIVAEVPELMPPETATGWALDNLYRVVYNLYRNQDREDRDDTENSRNL